MLILIDQFFSNDRNKKCDNNAIKMKAYVFQTLFLNYAIYFLLKMDRSLGVTNRLEKLRVHLIATYYELKKKPYVLCSFCSHVIQNPSVFYWG